MKSLIKCIAAVSLATCFSTGCNNNGGLIGMFSERTDTKPEAASVDAKDAPQPETVTGAKPAESSQAAPESIESKLATVNSRIVAPKEAQLPKGKTPPKKSTPENPQKVTFEVYSPQIKYKDYAGDCGADIPGCSKMEFGETVYGTIPNALCKRSEFINEDGTKVSNACLLETPFITEKDFNSANLNSGDVFSTTHKNNRKDAGALYQVISEFPEDAYMHCFESDGAFSTSFNHCYLHGHYTDDCDSSIAEKIIRVKIISGNANSARAANNAKPSSAAKDSQIQNSKSNAAPTRRVRARRDRSGDDTSNRRRRR